MGMDEASGQVLPAIPREFLLPEEVCCPTGLSCPQQASCPFKKILARGSSCPTSALFAPSGVILTPSILPRPPSHEGGAWPGQGVAGGAWPGGDGDAGAGRAAGGSGGGGGFQRLRRSVSAGGAGPTPRRGMLSYPRGRAGDAQPPFCILHPVGLPGGALLVLPPRGMLCILPGDGPAGLRSPLLPPVGLDWGCSAPP